MQKTSVETLRDEFRDLIRDRRSENNTNKIRFGVAEEVTEEDTLLNDFLREKDDEEERRTQEREETEQRTTDLEAHEESTRG